MLGPCHLFDAKQIVTYPVILFENSMYQNVWNLCMTVRNSVMKYTGTVIAWTKKKLYLVSCTCAIGSFLMVSITSCLQCYSFPDRRSDMHWGVQDLTLLIFGHANCIIWVNRICWNLNSSIVNWLVHANKCNLSCFYKWIVTAMLLITMSFVAVMSWLWVWAMLYSGSHPSLPVKCCCDWISVIYLTTIFWKLYMKVCKSVRIIKPKPTIINMYLLQILADAS